jgi:molybdopterin-guanine dinucleotide biosynthesis protein A
VTTAGAPLALGAVVLAGGTGRRLGGIDKAALEVDGVTLLERALVATAAAREVVVVGPAVPTVREVIWAVEDPPLGGPAAGLLAGLRRFEAAPDLVAVLAVDMPRVGPATVARLTWAVEADPAVDGAVLVDAGGRRQPLAAVYRTASLVASRAALADRDHGLPMRRLVGPLRLVDVPAVGDEARDVDTAADLADLRAAEDPGGRGRPPSEREDPRMPG